MNITELARRMRIRPDELREKLPELGFAVGKRAIKVDNKQAQKIMRAYSEMKRKERLAEKVRFQKSRAERLAEIPDSERKDISIPAIITVRDFASLLETPVPRVMQELMRNGIMASINERIDFDTASIIAEDLGFKPALEGESKEAEEDTGGIDKIVERNENDDKEKLVARAPVVVVMGHVDHGKTRLLDAIRKTNVIDTEAGGITQHIGAYQVKRQGKEMTFIDTPGHEAFTVMRSRGAKVADLAILVVAVDDGVQPQTKEAIDIIKSTKLPFLVALNKIDREGANIERVKGELAELGLVPEDWSGNTVMVPISAKQETNIEDLLDMLILISDVEKEKIVANPDHRALGTVIESNVDPNAGPVATVLVQSGTLKVGDVLGVKGSLFGKVRAMNNFKGEPIKTAIPSTPARIIGWKVAPSVGDIMEVPENPKDLKRIKSTDVSTKATEAIASIRNVRPSQDEDEDNKKQILKLIIRADMLGSLEAILGMLDKIKHDDVGVKVVQKGLGNITESDIASAEAGKAIIIGFNTRPSQTAKSMSRDKDVDIRQYTIIYKLFEDVIEELKKLLPSETILTEQGGFEVLKTFRKMDGGWIIGGKVKKEKIHPKSKVRLSRGEEYVGEGEIISLQLGRAELKVGIPGQEIGMSYKGKVKPEEGDILETYTEERVARELTLEGIDLR
jgi:translation initiation factor IF-2